MLDIVFHNFTADKILGEKFFRTIIKMAVEVLDSGKMVRLQNIGISINLVGEDKIRFLNKKYRGKDKSTDVLSFPMQSRRSHRSEEMKRPEGLFDYAQDPKSKNVLTFFDAGDIFICLPFAKRKAKLENVSIEKEVARLTVHGFLHLLGYDHERSVKDARGMFTLEGKILSKVSDL